jgi:hypothetical protein
MEKGRYDEACPKLVEAQKIDPGGGVLLALAICHEGEGKGATALPELREALALAKKAGRTDRETMAKDHLAKLEANVSRVIVTVPDDAPSGVALTLDGAPLSLPLPTEGIPLDAGRHTFVATAAGRKDWTRTFDVRATGDVHHLDVFLGGETAPASEKKDDAPKPVATSGSTRTLGYVVGGVGIVALGVGAAFGVIALKKTREYKDVCPGGACTDEGGIALHDDAKTAATISTIGLGVGIVGVGLGTYFLLSSPSEPPAPKDTALRAAPVISPQTLGFAVGGAF